MLLLLFLFAALCGGVFGFFIGLGLADGYKSKKTCRECLRTIVEWGFHSDGKEYVAVEKDKAKKEGLIYCGPCLHSNSAILRKIHNTPLQADR